MFSPKRVPISGAPEGLLLPYGPQDTDGKIVRLLSPSGGFEAIGITYLGGDRTLTCPVTSCSRLSQAGFGCNADVCSHEASDRRGDDESWLLAPPHRKFFRRSFCLPGAPGSRVLLGEASSVGGTSRRSSVQTSGGVRARAVRRNPHRAADARMVRFLHSGHSRASPDPQGPEDKEDAPINRSWEQC
jgi:hypothetical protein